MIAVDGESTGGRRLCFWGAIVEYFAGILLIVFGLWVWSVEVRLANRK
jgi:cytochrome c biogenesis protein CcdA